MNRMLAIAAPALAAGLLAISFAGFGAATSKDEASRLGAADEAEIRRIVEAYIRENPDVIIESVNAYATAQRARDNEAREQAARDAAPYLVTDEGAFAAGAAPDAATVAVVEFFDYHCGFCKRANGVMRDLVSDDPAVKVVFRELPILREESDLAAKYALAARDQGRYLDLHFAMLGASGVLTETRIQDIARKAGMDVERLTARAHAKDLKETLDLNYAIASDIGIEGTPAFLVASLSGDFISLIPEVNVDRLKAAIEDAKKAAAAAKAAD